LTSSFAKFALVALFANGMPRWRSSATSCGFVVLLATMKCARKSFDKLSALSVEFADAIEDGDSEKVKLLVSRGAVDVNARLERYLTPPPLVHAVRQKHYAIVDCLLRANARIDDTDGAERTACHVAVMHSRDDLLALLLARRPNLALLNSNGESAFDIALSTCMYDDGRCALRLVEAGQSLERMDRHHLCGFASTSTAAIQAIRDCGVVLSALRNSNGATPLHLAAGRPLTPAGVVGLLVECGVDLEVRDAYDRTCVHVAATFSRIEALRCLVGAGADVNSVVDKGSTALHLASDYDCVVCLLAAGADVCARNDSGIAVVQLAARELPASCLCAMVAGGADLDDALDDGRTARQALAGRGWTIDPDQVEAARRDIAKARIDFVRHRALVVCIGLQAVELAALQCAKFCSLHVVPWRS
jgi:ankyrin repeat protein